MTSTTNAFMDAVDVEKYEDIFGNFDPFVNHDFKGGAVEFIRRNNPQSTDVAEEKERKRRDTIRAHASMNALAQINVNIGGLEVSGDKAWQYLDEKRKELETEINNIIEQKDEVLARSQDAQAELDNVSSIADNEDYQDFVFRDQFGNTLDSTITLNSVEDAHNIAVIREAQAQAGVEQLNSFDPNAPEFAHLTAEEKEMLNEGVDQYMTISEMQELIDSGELSAETESQLKDIIQDAETDSIIRLSRDEAQFLQEKYYDTIGIGNRQNANGEWEFAATREDLEREQEKLQNKATLTNKEQEKLQYLNQALDEKQQEHTEVVYGQDQLERAAESGQDIDATDLGQTATDVIEEGYARDQAASPEPEPTNEPEEPEMRQVAAAAPAGP